MSKESMRLAAAVRPDLLDRLMWGDMKAQQELDDLAEGFEEAGKQIEQEDAT